MSETIINGIIEESQEVTGQLQYARGAKGDDGVGISDISKTSTEGKVDTYTITLTDGTTKIFTVTNGDDGANGISVSDTSINASGHLIVILSDGTSIDAGVAKGDSGIYIGTIPPTDPSIKVWIDTSGEAGDVEMTSNKVISISSESTDTQYPSAKAVSEAVSEAAQGVFDKVVKKYTRRGFELLNTTLTESVSVIEFENKGCDEIYIYGVYKKASAIGHVTANAYFGSSKRDILRSNNSVSATIASVPFSFILKFGIPRPKYQNQYLSTAICGSNSAAFGASVYIRNTYQGIVPDKIVMTCSSEFAVGTEIFIVGVKTNG